MSRKKLPREEVTVPVKFPKALNKKTFMKLLFDLAKNLLLQKHQIPLQFEAIAKEVELEATLAGGSLDEDDSEEQELVTREMVRERQRRVRQRKSKAQLMRNGQRLLESFHNVENVMRSEFAESNDVVSVSFVFGATPHSAREIYTVPTPDNLTEDDDVQPRVGIHLLRAMMAHDTLHDVTSSRLPVSNMFVLIAKNSSTSSSSTVSLPEYSLPSPSRCSRVSFHFSFPAPVSTLSAKQRLRFTSGAEPCRHPSGSGPASMDLCTPYTQLKQLPRVPGQMSIEDMQLCTPAVRWKSHPTDLLQPDSMEMCTPAMAKINQRIVFCTPAVSQLPSSMELCTPAVVDSPAAITTHSISMDLCTPAVGQCKKRLDTESMDLCTPAPVLLSNDLRKTVNTAQEDSFGLGTPDISNLSLLSPQKRNNLESKSVIQGNKVQESSPNKKTKMDEMFKDSGISSPEASLSEELTWFMIEEPIRGFKHRPS